MAKIYLVHSIEENLHFLYKVVKPLSKEFPQQVVYLRLSNNSSSHNTCLSALKHANRGDLICFFCHGRSDGLLGCRFRACYPTHRRKYEHNPDHNGLFIDLSNISVLKDKKVFCLACDSNKIARMAIDAGAAVFVGFDNINLNTTADVNVRANAKYSLRRVVRDALRHSIMNKLTFNELVDYLKLIINQQNASLILGHKGHRGYKYYLRTANIMQEIKEGIKVWGDGTLHFWE